MSEEIRCRRKQIKLLDSQLGNYEREVKDNIERIEYYLSGGFNHDSFYAHTEGQRVASAYEKRNNEIRPKISKIFDKREKFREELNLLIEEKRNNSIVCNIFSKFLGGRRVSALNLLLEGDNSKREGRLDRAYRCYLKAAKAGNAAGMDQVGQCLRDGMGVELNLDSAIIWFKKAAERGHTSAQFNLGCLYESHLKDLNKALFWYEESAGNGNSNGAFNASDIYLERGDRDNWQKHALLAVELGDPDALSMLRKKRPDIGNRLRINKSPRIFIGCSASRSPLTKRWIEDSFIPFLKSNNLEYFYYLTGYPDRGENVKLSKRDIQFELSNSDVYIRFLDSHTRLFNEGGASPVEASSFLESDSFNFGSVDYYRWEQNVSYTYFRSSLSQAIFYIRDENKIANEMNIKDRISRSGIETLLYLNPLAPSEISLRHFEKYLQTVYAF